MNYIAVIPARYAASRLPGKPLADILGRPMVAHVVDRANESSADRVIVATDDSRIAEALTREPCEICMTKPDHVSGSDRLAEVVDKLELSDEQIIVNVQGDEPMISPLLIDQVAEILASSESAVMATAAKKIASKDDLNNPNIVKVVFNQIFEALYFSRAAIPFEAESSSVVHWHHIGIYAYRAGFLRRYPTLKASEIEQAERLEQLRVLDNGERILVKPVDMEHGIGVDTEEDLIRVRALMDGMWDAFE